MASPYVLSNADLQLMRSEIASRFQLYVAFYNPVALTTTSQDVQQDNNGQYTILESVDLLAQHRAPYAPQPNFGPNRIGFVNEPLFFDGSRSSQRGNIPARGHTWDVVGSGVTIEVFDGPYAPGGQARMTFSSPGLYTVILTVYDRFGGSSTGQRQVLIYQDRQSTPAGVASFSGVNGSISGGGYTATISSAFELAPIPSPAALPIGQFLPITVMADIFAEISPGSWYPIAETGPWGLPHPGEYYNDPRILFSGYVVNANSTKTIDGDTVTYNLATANMLLQQASIHNIGYYHTAYATRSGAGIPLSLSSSNAVGKGQLVADLTSEDVYRSLLLDHSNFGTYHDVHITRDFLPTDPTGAVPTFDSSYTFYQLTYTTLSASEGAIWSALTTLAKNEFHQIWCERDSALCIGPQLQLRGYEMLKQPTVYPPLRAAQILNARTELQRVDPSTGQLGDDAVRQNQPVYPLNLWGPNALPSAHEANSRYVRDLSRLIGPPILCALSDTPVYDTAAAPPDDMRLFPWVRANWPQDLAVHPLQITVNENYTERTGVVKLVATMVNQQNFWSSWYPTGTFTCAGIMMSATPAGAWDVQTDLLLADISAASGATSRNLAWQYLWEMARRVFFANNKHYEAQIQLGLMPWAHFNDIVLVSRSKGNDGPSLFQMPMAITGITMQIDLNRQVWQTQLVAEELTSATLGPMQTPVCAIPKQ